MLVGGVLLLADALLLSGALAAVIEASPVVSAPLSFDDPPQLVNNIMVTSVERKTGVLQNGNFAVEIIMIESPFYIEIIIMFLYSIIH